MNGLYDLKEILINKVAGMDVTAGAPDRIWATNNKHIQHHILQGNLDDFLQWDVIQYTMFVMADTPFIQKEYALLKQSSQWDRWQSILHECEVGCPTRSGLDHTASPNLIHQVFSLMVLENHMKDYVHNLEIVFEFGGGYGCMARLIHALGFTGQYILVDTPLISALQQYYLEACGVDGVWYADDIATIPLDLAGTNSAFIANWSLSECPINVRNAVFNKVEGVKHMQVAFQRDFGSYNNMQYFQMLDIDNPSFKKTNLTFIPATPKNSYYMLGASW